MRSFIVLGVFVSLASLLTTNAESQPNAKKVEELRKQLMYPYQKEHLNTEIRNSQPQIKIDLNFPVPFFGSTFNYTFVSLLGVLKFSAQHDDLLRYPLKFPSDQWPDKPDPPFIAPFFALALVGKGDSPEAVNAMPPGVYVKAYRNISSSKSQDDVDLHEAIRQDVQEGMIGATHFQPKHVIIVTWRNITFGGNYNPYRTNTYQVVVTTDERRTYAIFNYQNITWTTSTEAGGDTILGEGGIPAFVGFNAGRGRRAFEYTPYSQTHRIFQLRNRGQINNHPERHIFRVDEFIQQGSCDADYETARPNLTLSTSSAKMLGGTIVNISGPCFEADKKIRVVFHDQEVLCIYRTQRVATCVTPKLYVTGFVRVATVFVPGERQYRTSIYIENPMIGSEPVWVEDRHVFSSLDVKSFDLHWDYTSLDWSPNKIVEISLYGYKESATGPQVQLIRQLKTTVNNGSTVIDTSEFSNADDGDKRNFTVGLIQISINNASAVWSRPIPLGWYFSSQWQKQLGPNWPESKCNAWVKQDSALRSFDPASLPACPCTLDEARVDMGRFVVDSNCDEMGEQSCYGNSKIRHCVISAQPSAKAAGQVCCYDSEGIVAVPTSDDVYGFSLRSHPFGQFPYHNNWTVPGLSHWYQDLAGYYTCCVWSNGNDTCSKFMSLRPSNDCTGYKRNNVSQVYGDPHFINHDNLEYTFNGKGEFVLVHVNKNHHQLNIQARFEQYFDERSRVKRPGTQLTAVVAKSTTSSMVEIQQRSTPSNYQLGVLVDGQPVYFDRRSNLRTFTGVTVYTPPNIRNQSIVVVAFESGAGIEVINQLESIAVRIYLPQSFMKLTRGLMGNWSNDPSNDLVTAEGLVAPFDSDDMERIHMDFGLSWMLGRSYPNMYIPSYFHYENNRSSSFYNDVNFRPIFETNPKLPTTLTERDIELACWSIKGEVSRACRYDYIATESRDVARATQYFVNDFYTIVNYVPDMHLCPAIKLSPHMRISTTRRYASTTVQFECENGSVLHGATKRSCLPSFQWSPALDEQESKCVILY